MLQWQVVLGLDRLLFGFAYTDGDVRGSDVDQPDCHRSSSSDRVHDAKFVPVSQAGRPFSFGTEFVSSLTRATANTSSSL